MSKCRFWSSFVRCRMYDFVYTTDLGVILLLYRQDRHRTRWSELRPTPAKLVVEKGGITAVGLYVSWARNMITVKENCRTMLSIIITQQEKIQRTEEKRCTVNHVAEFENGTPILKERRFGGILYWCDWGAPNGARTEWFPEHRFYSVFRAPLLLLS